MQTVQNSPVMLYTEQTPNPEALKYVTNRMLYRGLADFKDKDLAATWSPLANSLMELPYVKGVYLSNNFITITKEPNYEWHDIQLRLKEFVKDYIEKDGVIVKEGFAEYIAQIEAANTDNRFSGEEGEIVRKIREIIDSHIKPGVEMDGGNIEFKDFKDGKVTVVMQGSCSGCPSSTVTLKAGIERILKHMVPQVTEVVQEMG
ncbi:MAG: NifU family protein [Saprospiraceae bacterium]